MDRRKLQSRLARVRALAHGGSTPGERRAARLAEARLEARLRQSAPPVPLDAALQPCGPEVVPPASALVAALRAWAAGERTAEDLAEEALALVDRVVLPDCPPDDPLSIRVEVVMLLTTLPNGPVCVRDVHALCRFLTAEDPASAWAAWFDHLRGAAGPAFSAG